MFFFINIFYLFFIKNEWVSCVFYKDRCYWYDIYVEYVEMFSFGGMIFDLKVIGDGF